MTKDLKDERFLLKGDAYIVDLANVDFLTWRKNEKENGTYWLKMHFQTKEARYICDKYELATIVMAWTKMHGKELDIDINELGDSYGNNR